MSDRRTDVLVIGGGITGLGVARDLAERGVDVTLVERDGLAAGATGGMHGLLHSGARYALAEPDSARQCRREGEILREIAGHAITDTGGLFLAHEDDPSAHLDDRLAACRDCGIPAERIDGDRARELEPSLAGAITDGFTVPDAVVDPFRLAVATAAAAERAGARIEPHAAVTALHTADGRVVGATVEHADGPSKARPEAPTGPDEPVPAGTEETIRAAHTVNAAGAWADRVAGLAGHTVPTRPTRGVMTVVSHDETTRVCNRCRPKTDGDILVPAADGAIVGTTSVAVDDPDEYPTEQWEQQLVIEELAELVPAVADSPVVESYWGVRPLYDPSADAEPTDASRGFAVLNHDGGGLTSVVGGKLTTHRLMAEHVGDTVADALGVSRDSTTADQPLVGADDTPLAPYLDAFAVETPDSRRLPQPNAE